MESHDTKKNEEDTEFLKKHPEFEHFLGDLKSVFRRHEQRRLKQRLEWQSVAAQQAYQHVFGARCRSCLMELAVAIETTIRPLGRGELSKAGNVILADIDRRLTSSHRKSA